MNKETLTACAYALAWELDINPGSPSKKEAALLQAGIKKYLIQTEGKCHIFPKQIMAVIQNLDEIGPDSLAPLVNKMLPVIRDVLNIKAKPTFKLGDIAPEV